ncbi:GNAT family N-acetyltransferase [Nocardia australiensis]|uniref:GNAT family N-acetyltransferase n=1 Tax=Nocardia australiensis TaxID=2887191 RepID=UPI001D1360AD|nr:GNAT family N-acetyltransferase [Nocardia australiensis]
MGPSLTVRRAGAEDRDAVVEAFVVASVDEVVTAWVLEGYSVEQFQTSYAPLVIDAALTDDEVWIAESGTTVLAVSIWQTATSAARFETEAAEARQRAQAAPEVRPLQRAAYAMTLVAKEHPRKFPHRYLQMIVTRPEYRGVGAGAAILADRLKAAAAAGMPAFLEASTERSARLYGRHGFVRDGATYTLPEGGPTLIPMWFRG